jgi:hypothetical protein
MYRHGLGDCFLITLRRETGAPYYIMIDCGVILGTPDAATQMQRVVADIRQTTDGKIDLLLATHEHWDHLSGFLQAADEFRNLRVDQVWLAWTEDPNDPLATRLKQEHNQALAGLRLSAMHLQLAQDDERAADLTSVLDFFGAAGGSTSDALEAVRSLGRQVRYCRPQDAPVDLGDPAVRLYVLGPPPDEKLLKLTRPSTTHPETYGLVGQAFQAGIAPALEDPTRDAPFGSLYAIPNQVAQAMPFFSGHYWGADAWRRADTAWLADSAELALQLDNMTNNTCLVLAIELGGGDVLIFPGDAQVGNWLSWQDLRWQTPTGVVTGPDLLERAIFYKVGHHGSHNATLREKGLEMMGALKAAMVPVNQAMAATKGWDQMPLPALLDALNTHAHGAVLRADREPPPGFALPLVAEDLYFEITL